jgi:tRNA(fMet)-specific endonuclease VapC
MIGNNFLLDTNIIIAWFKGEVSIAEKIDKASSVHIPIIVIGELYYGALYSSSVQKNINDIRSVTDRYDVLYIDEAAAIAYGLIKANLRKKGKPIPENDLWIAAIAQRYELIIISRDSHFKEIENVSLKSW